MAASIREVANRAGVSTAAVSIYLNKPDTTRVGVSTKRKIDRAVRDLNYRRNLFAASLSREKSMIVGVIIPTVEPHFRNLFTNTLLSGAQELLAESGYSMLFFPASGGTSMEIVQEQVEKSVGCDGYLLFSTGFCPMDDIHHNIRELQRTGKPFVTLNVPEVEEPVDQILIQDLGNAAGVEYLLKAGHRDVLLVLGRKNGEHSRLILEDYRRVLNRFDLPFENDRIVYGSYNAESTYNVVTGFFAKGGRVTGICCMSDTMATGAAAAVRTAGFAIPRDISIIGRNNSPLAGFHDPPLTTVDIRITEAGREGARILLENLDHRAPPQKIRLTGSVIERESVNEVRPS